MSNDISKQRERDQFLRNNLPMEESEWPGITLAYHVLNAVGQNPDPVFRDRLSDAFIGQRAAMFDETNDLLGLRIKRLRILDDCVLITYLDQNKEYTLKPRADEPPTDSIVHSFLVPAPTETNL